MLSSFSIWLILKGRIPEATTVLKKFASKRSAEVVDDQILEIQESISSGKDSSLLNDIKLLFVWKNAKIVLLGLPLQFFVIATGNPIYFYSETIFCSLGIVPFVTTIVVGSLSLAGAVFTTIFIDKLGRKWLLVGGSFMMSVCICTAAVLVHVYELEVKGHDVVGYIVAVLVSLFMLAYTATWFVVPWVLTGEMFPLEGRGLAVGICTALNWLTAYALTQVFPMIITSFGSHGSLYLLGIIDVLSLVFVLFFLPETKGTTLEDIQELFNKPWVERIGISRRCSFKCKKLWSPGEVSATNPMRSTPPDTPEDSPQLTRSHGNRRASKITVL